MHTSIDIWREINELVVGEITERATYSEQQADETYQWYCQEQQAGKSKSTSNIQVTPTPTHTYHTSHPTPEAPSPVVSSSAPLAPLRMVAPLPGIELATRAGRAKRLASAPTPSPKTP